MSVFYQQKKTPFLISFSSTDYFSLTLSLYIVFFFLFYYITLSLIIPSTDFFSQSQMSSRRTVTSHSDSGSSPLRREGKTPPSLKESRITGESRKWERREEKERGSEKGNSMLTSSMSLFLSFLFLLFCFPPFCVCLFFLLLLVSSFCMCLFLSLNVTLYETRPNEIVEVSRPIPARRPSWKEKTTEKKTRFL